MSLPAPNLDDRTFQDLVDDAKRFVQHRCPAWTDHNVSDPGVTLIETFAWMTDLLLYRLNRVPERLYVKFLELIGVSLFPPTTAQVDVTFRLSAPQDAVVRVERGAIVSTPRTTTDAPISFTTNEPLDIVPARSQVIGSMIRADQLHDHTPAMGMGSAFEPFDSTPKVDDALYIGLDRAAPLNTLLVRFVCEVGGHGIDPTDPPLWWEAWDGYSWVRCRVLSDTTGGLNLSGDVEIQLPRVHAESALARRTSAWVRCRVIEPGERRPYRSSPRIVSVWAASIGGTCQAEHGEEIEHELLGISEGVPAQEFTLRHTPITLADVKPVLEVRTQRVGMVPEDPDETEAAEASEDWEEWTLVPTFADSDPDHRNYMLDARTGVLRLGPAIRLPDGALRQFGAVPPKGATLRLRSYRTGGGGRGNVAAGAISVLRSSIPYVASVTNARAATGGVDAESMSEARERGPLTLRTRNRAVTAEDYEILAREAAPEAARVRCVVLDEGPDAGAVRILIVPAAAQEEGRIEFRDLVPDEDIGSRVQQYLDERRVVGTRVRVEPPSYLGVKVEASLRARQNADPHRLQTAALRALYTYFNPLTGGPDGRGWPFGRPVQLGEVYGVLQGVRGLDFVENAVVMRVNPLSGETNTPEERIDLAATSLVFSFGHVVEVL